MLKFITGMLRTSAAAARAHAAIVAQSKFNNTHDIHQTVDTTTNSATSTSHDGKPFSNTQHDDAVELDESEMDSATSIWTLLFGTRYARVALLFLL